MDGYRTITASLIRTPGYLLRYKAFQKYLEDFPPYGPSSEAN
jgi:hypothetical protein